MLVVVSGGELDAIGMQREVADGVANVEKMEFVFFARLPEVEVSASTSANRSDEMTFGMQRKPEDLAVHARLREMSHRLFARFPINHTECGITDARKCVRDVRDAPGSELLPVFGELHRIRSAVVGHEARVVLVQRRDFERSNLFTGLNFPVDEVRDQITRQKVLATRMKGDVVDVPLVARELANQTAVVGLPKFDFQIVTARRDE